MIDSYHSFIQRKSIKQIKLGCVTVWLLKRRGEKDCKNKIVRQTERGQFYSPFLNREISLCMATIQNEKEILTKILTNIDVDITDAEFRIEQAIEQIDKMQSTMLENIYNNKILAKESVNFSEMTTDIIENYHERELKVRISAKTKKMDDLSKFIVNNRIRKEQKLQYAENEVAITKIRCRQLYELLKARISAYWTGVLNADAAVEDILMSPILNVDDLTREIQIEIDNFVRERKNVEE